MAATPDSPERLVLFTDAVVAIALTLLVLPLTDIVPDLVAGHGTSIEAITDHQWQIRSFLLSFVVVGRQWLSHHRLFAHVARSSPGLIGLNLAWLLTVVVVPFPTELVGAFGADRFACLCYVGTILANSVCLTALVALVRRNPEMTADRGPVSHRWWISSVVTTASLVLAFGLAALVPGVNYLALLLLLSPTVVSHLMRPGHRTRTNPASTGV
jgi:uncharacterized membrane protein